MPNDGILITASSNRDNYNMNDFYCAAPWRGLHINPRGDVKTCCAGDPNMLGNLNEHSITDILNSDLMKGIRRSISKGNPHRYCSNCVLAERLGGDSERKWHNDVNPNFDYNNAGVLYHHPVIVDVRWNITCNLSCNYCSDWASSKWAALKNIPFKSGSRPYYEAVCNFIDEHKEHIHEVALVGGEPLLLPENDRLLEVIPKDSIVTLITNMSVDMENNKIFKKLSQRNRVGWSMSFDNVGDRFEYVRYGGNWKLLQKNLKLVKELINTQGHWGGIHAVYNIYNATRVCELKEFARDAGLTVLWQNLFQPDYLDPFLHGKKIAELAASEIENFFATELVTDSEKIFFSHALEKYHSITEERPFVTKDFKQHIDQIESNYHKDKQGQFTILWPELKELISV